MDERWNQTLKQMIVKFTSQKKEQWDEFLDTCVFAYNTAQHESTQYTPFQLMFGRKAVLPVDVDFESRDEKTLLTEYQKSSVNIHVCVQVHIHVLVIIIQLSCSLT